MGSGLILLVIVGAWLAVLVPMGLRSHDSATSSRSAERFSDAMRVLSRRSAVADAYPDGSESYDAAPLDEADDQDEAPARRRPSELVRDLDLGRFAPSAATWRRMVPVRTSPGQAPRGTLDSGETRTAPAPRPVLSAAARRRRVLTALSAVAAVGVVLGLLGSTWALVVGVGAAVAAAAFVLLLVLQRRAATARRAPVRTARPAERPARPAAPRPDETAAPAHVVVRREPARPAAPARRDLAPTAFYDQEAEPVRVPAPAPAARPAPQPAAASAYATAPATPARPVVAQPLLGGTGGEWTPVPVPPPMYVGKAVASRPAAATAEQDSWSADLYADAPQVATEGGDAAYERPRAVGGW